MWAVARRVALLLARGRCEVCGSTDVQVHHDPPVGALGYRRGCQHHQERLHVLCPAHHREHERAIRAAAAGRATQLSLVA